NARVVIVEVFREFSDPVYAEGRIGSPLDFLMQTQGTENLQAGAVTPRNIHPRISAHIIDLAGKDKLIPVTHQVIIDPEIACLETSVPACFQVIKAFRVGTAPGGGFSVIVPVRLLVGHAERCVHALAWIQLEADS